MDDVSRETPEYVIRGVSVEQLPKLWKHGEAFIKRALDRGDGEFTHLDIREFCEQKKMQLWLIGCRGRVIAAVLTEIACYPRKKNVVVFACAGKDIDHWIEKFDKLLEEWGLSLGCEGIEGYVRIGFTKKITRLGYNKKSERFYRPIL